MIPQTALEIPAVVFDAHGQLCVTASATSSPHDFDFYQGKWRLRNRKLKTRLNGCTEWVEFESTQEMYKILNGLGNLDNYLATFDGQPFEGLSLRLFNPVTRLWSIYWADSNEAVLQPPVLGSFDKQVAHFFTQDTFNGRDILVVFRWDARDPQHPVWSQAFSPDRGQSWEWNWYMHFSKFE